MIQVFELSPGVTLRCYKDDRFKQGRISFQFVRPMCRQEAALNALLPTVLLRGTARHRDLRAITMHEDDLYGATVGDLVRRIGDFQTTGLYCGFTGDRFAMAGDKILEPTVDFLRELLLEPLTENGVFREDIVQSEKKNLIAAIESGYNDKRSYAAEQLIRAMCPEDSFGVPRLGEIEWVEEITAGSLYEHYQTLLRSGAVEIFYVGAAEPEQAAALLGRIFDGSERKCAPLPPQTALQPSPAQRQCREMDISQSLLNMGFVTDITGQSPDYAAMRVFNAVFGAGMTSKLFMNVREKLSLCYSIGSHYYMNKGILTVGAGIDSHQEETVHREVRRQLDACRNGDISLTELNAAKQSLLSGLRGIYDSPGSIESYFSTMALSGFPCSVAQYRAAVETVTAAEVAAAAGSLREHSVYFLKGVSQ